MALGSVLIRKGSCSKGLRVNMDCLVQTLLPGISKSIYMLKYTHAHIQIWKQTFRTIEITRHKYFITTFPCSHSAAQKCTSYFGSFLNPTALGECASLLSYCQLTCRQLWFLEYINKLVFCFIQKVSWV